MLQSENDRRGVQLLRRAQDAMGGAEKLAAVRDTMHVMEDHTGAGAGGYKMKQVSRFVAPDRFRSEQDTPFGRIVVYSDGKNGWITTPQRRRSPYRRTRSQSREAFYSASPRR